MADETKKIGHGDNGGGNGKKKPGPKEGSIYTDDFINAEADALMEYAQGQHAMADTAKNEVSLLVPFLCHFATKRGYPGSYISDWAKKNHKIAFALKRFKDYQEAALIGVGLVSKNPAFAIFALKNVAGWRDAARELEDDETKGKALVFNGVPQNGEGQHRFQKFLTQ